jgi:hypothetical protein
MRNQFAVAAAVLAGLPLLSCTNATTPTPAATPTPVATPTPTPTPAPITSPSPSPSTKPPDYTNEPAVYATAGVHSYLHKGKLVRSGANSYSPGDVIYLNCSPRDANGSKTTNHGNVRYWRIYSNDLTVNVDFYFTDTNSFTPDLHINAPLAKGGTVKAQCAVANLPLSNTHNMKINSK